MTEMQARALIDSLTSKEKQQLLRLLANLDTIKDTAEAYQLGLLAGRESRQRKEAARA